ncbi:FAD-dependent oxidoreductase [Actinoplanes utahensis]|uniref:FAD-dependent oxidoreductase n=1 Tax=Actinoplanes utahensis TaxID=1869 RepID=UPI0007C692EF|nr:FAD-dependent oxidoreductase [Actinoplanes utahensis]GIF29748.1 hypothetical protein Aut01nite_27340 [Actinoplanes utahensis]
MEKPATVVVVGFGAAGACAAIEAAEAGAEVLVIDRFHGGGATAISGGVVYAGGGTRQQRAAGVTDDPAAMYAYLRHEVRDAVSPATLRRFCDESADMLAWLEEHGVPFGARLCPYKTSYPADRHYLYQSGSEHAYPDPAPRGHRTFARGTSGGLLHARLAEAARSRRIRFLPQTRAASLHWTTPAVIATGTGRPGTDTPGRGTSPERRIAGVVCRTLRDAPGWARLAHRTLHRLSVKPGVYLPAFGRMLHRWTARIEDRHGRALHLRADAVVLAAGGFVFDREMMREHAPGYRGLRLGTPGDDGSGIRLGTAAGAGTRHLDRITIWRFLTPPSALLGGILVDRDGRRVCDESRYGAAIGEAVRRCPGGRAWLLVDATILAEARRQIGTQTLWFQRLQMWWLLTAHRTTAPTLADLARRTGLDPDGLAATVDAYHAGQAGARSAADDRAPGASPDADGRVPGVGGGAAGVSGDVPGVGGRAAGVGGGDPGVGGGDSGVGGRDPAGKPAALSRPLVTGPFSALDVSLRTSPAPMLTLGGLTVDEATGQALRPDGTVIPGLYAAGRTASGICSGSYVSGLSLADCVFSGRRAGRHAGGGGARVARVRPGNSDEQGSGRGHRE